MRLLLLPSGRVPNGDDWELQSMQLPPMPPNMSLVQAAVESVCCVSFKWLKANAFQYFQQCYSMTMIGMIGHSCAYVLQGFEFTEFFNNSNNLIIIPLNNDSPISISHVLLLFDL